MFRKRQPEQKSNLIYSETSKNLINSMPLQNMLKIADSVVFLEHTRYREEHKSNLFLTINGASIWSLIRGHVWMAYREESGGAIFLEWVSVISKFRR